jgi:hypothetical protein
MRTPSDVTQQKDRIAADAVDSVAIKLDQFGQRLNTLGSTILEQWLIPLFEQLEPPLTATVQGITYIANGFKWLNEHTGGLAAEFALVTPVIIGIRTAFAFGTAALEKFTQSLWNASLQTKLNGQSSSIAAGAAGIAGGAGIGMGMKKIAGTALAFLAGPEMALIVGAVALFMAGKDLLFPSSNSREDEIADNTKRAADSLQQMRIDLIGGGRIAKRIASGMEIDYAMNQRIYQGMG